MNKRDDRSKQYFIALIPPSPVYEDALKLKQHFADNHNSKAALNSPPHITIHMPFRWKEQNEGEIAEKLNVFVKKFAPIKVCLDNFGSFAPRVIFINVVKSDALLHFQKSVERFCRLELNLLNANHGDEPFHPHLTVAFRDLRKAAFNEAWEVFQSREYKAEFMADKLSLMKHDGKRWQVCKEFNLESAFSTEVTEDLETTEG